MQHTTRPGIDGRHPAHPAVIVSAFGVAPVTTLHPLIGAGHVLAFLQAWLVPPMVRELESVMKRALTLADGGKIRLADLSSGVRGALDTGPRFGAPRKYRAGPGPEKLERLLREHGGNISAVAKAITGSHCNGYRFFGLEATP